VSVDSEEDFWIFCGCPHKQLAQSSSWKLDYLELLSKLFKMILTGKKQRVLEIWSGNVCTVECGIVLTNWLF
jgi:hypothetical protein